MHEMNRRLKWTISVLFLSRGHKYRIFFLPFYLEQTFISFDAKLPTFTKRWIIFIYLFCFCTTVYRKLIETKRNIHLKAYFLDFLIWQTKILKCKEKCENKLLQDLVLKSFSQYYHNDSMTEVFASAEESISIVVFHMSENKSNFQVFDQIFLHTDWLIDWL